MIDFASLVLAPAMAVFGQPVSVTPVKSQPGQPAYTARGVYSLKVVQIPLEGSDLTESTNQPTLGIRVADYPVMLKQEDVVIIPQGRFRVQDVQLDGQGGADIPLRQLPV